MDGFHCVGINLHRSYNSTGSNEVEEEHNAAADINANEKNIVSS
jgi:hypothetical protein